MIKYYEIYRKGENMRFFFDKKESTVNFGLQEDSVFFYSETDSTNTRAKEAFLSFKSKAASMLFVAEKQTAGRGTRGRSFHSSGDTGLWFSLLYIPDSENFDSAALTPAAAAAVIEALDEVLGKDATNGFYIKWVNDIFFEKRKVCGILSERVCRGDGLVGYIIGIGINLFFSKDLPDDIQNIAISVEEAAGKRIDKALLLSSVLRRLFGYLNGQNREKLYSAYAERSMKKGTPITLTDGLGRVRRALFAGIDSDFRLIAEYENGERESLVSADVSVRP